jgi:hypothetical protein
MNCFDNNQPEKQTSRISLINNSKNDSKILGISEDKANLLASTNSFDLFNKYWRDKADETNEQKLKHK